MTRNQDTYPVRWMDRQAIVTLPEQIDVTNAGQIREELLLVINHGAAALVHGYGCSVSRHVAMIGVSRRSALLELLLRSGQYGGRRARARSGRSRQCATPVTKEQAICDPGNEGAGNVRPR